MSQDATGVVADRKHASRIGHRHTVNGDDHVDAQQKFRKALDFLRTADPQIHETATIIAPDPKEPITVKVPLALRGASSVNGDVETWDKNNPKPEEPYTSDDISPYTKRELLKVQAVMERLAGDDINNKQAVDVRFERPDPASDAVTAVFTIHPSRIHNIGKGQAVNRIEEMAALDALEKRVAGRGSKQGELLQGSEWQNVAPRIKESTESPRNLLAELLERSRNPSPAAIERMRRGEGTGSPGL